MNKRFLNPYHFVPADDAPEDFRTVEGEPSAKTYFDIPPDTIGARLGSRSHDRYCEDSYSGRIICKLTARTPLIVGGKRRPHGDGDKPDDYTLIEPYRLGDKFALPATSLKGMLSTIAEAASFSALRVLNDLYPISYRQAAGDAPSAMGVIERNQETGEMMLRPVALPNMEITNGRLEFPARPPAAKRLWERAFPEFVTLKVKYRSARSRRKAWPGGSLEDLQAAYRNRQIRLAEKGRWVYGQFPHGGYLDCLGHDHDLYTHGATIETGRKFDVFLPDPPDGPRNPPLRIKEGVIAAFEALARDAMENANSDLKLPFAPRRLGHDGKLAPRVLDMIAKGLTVYFDIEDGGNGHPIVSKIQLSSIWRDGVEDGDDKKDVLAHLNAFFPEDRRPMQAGRSGRITPAEWLFGFVREDKGTGKPKRAGYAGRVRVSNARLGLGASGVSLQEELLCRARPEWNTVDPALSGDELTAAQCRQARVGDHIRLRELSSPKPPSPQLYFRARQGNDSPIAKKQLDIRKHSPQGIKLYLHHHLREDDTSGESILEAARTRLPMGTEEEEKAAQRKVAVKPLKPGSTFWFHIDFDNLTRFELELLCFALRPSGDFHHKLGMAKPLGLGTISIEPVAFFQIDRTARYTRGSLFSSARYCAAHGAAEHIRALPKMPYAKESATAAAKDNTTLTPSALAASYRKRLEETQPGQEVWQALQALGRFPRRPEEDGGPLPVHTPLAVGQNHDDSREKETFRWFVNNESHLGARDSWRDPQFLRPIRDASALPVLLTNRSFVGRKANQPVTVLLPEDHPEYEALEDAVRKRIAKEASEHVGDRMATRLEPVPAGTTAVSEPVHAILERELTETIPSGERMAAKRLVVLVDIIDDLASQEPEGFESDWAKRMIWLTSETFAGAIELKKRFDAVLNPPEQKTHRRTGHRPHWKTT